jgi:hypothetical protein
MSCAEVCNLLCTHLVLGSGFTWWWLYKDTTSDKLIIIGLSEKTFCLLHIYGYVQLAVLCTAGNVMYSGQSQLNSTRKVRIWETQLQWCLETSATLWLCMEWDETLVTVFEKGGYLLFRVKLKVGFIFSPLFLFFSFIVLFHFKF